MPRSIPRFLQETAKQRGSKRAVVSRERAITFDELLNEALATAECLREMGIQPGDRVGVCMEKTVDQVSVILGTLYANAVLVPILPRLKGPNIRHIIDNSGMSAMITDRERIDEVAEFAELVKLVIGHGDVDDSLPNLPYMRRFVPPRAFFDRIGNDNAAIIYSSGSTGRPKGILISHRNLADGADIVAEYLGTSEDDLFALMSKEGITALPVMPVIISKIFDPRLKLAMGRYDFSALRYVCSTGGRVSSDMISNLRSAFPKAKFYSMFGLTEAFRSTFLDPDQLEARPTSIGKSIPDCQVMVLDEHGEECAPDVVGELVHRGTTVTKGYWRDPENTGKVFRPHPRFPGELLVFSGDRAYRDKDGYLYFVARVGERICVMEGEGSLGGIGRAPSALDENLVPGRARCSGRGQPQGGQAQQTLKEAASHTHLSRSGPPFYATVSMTIPPK